MKPEKAWAAVALHGSPRPFIHNGAVRSSRAEVQEYIGAAWAREGETVAQGWKRAYRGGWRAVRVVVEACHDALSEIEP